MLTKSELIEKLRALVKIQLDCEQEYASIKGNACAIDPETDAKEEIRIHRALSRGNEWAWCCAKLTVSYDSLESVEYLGCCSYESAEDFKLNSGYYEDMIKEALNSIADSLIKYHRLVESF